MPKISVIMPVYNCESLVRDTAAAILAQTVGDLELIMADDGSTDATGAICDAICEGDGRARVIHMDNLGVSAARNRGLDAASGDYVMFVDGDDLVAPDILERLLSAAQGANAPIAVCGLRFCYPDRQNDRDYPPPAFAGDMRDFVKGPFEAAWRSLCLHGPVNKLFDRSCIEKNGLRFDESLSICEDAMFVFGFLRACDRIAVIPDCLYYYRQNADGLMSKYNDNAIAANFDLFACVLSFLEHNGADEKMKKTVASDFFGRTYSFVYQIYSRAALPAQRRRQLLKQELYTPQAARLWDCPMSLPASQRVVRALISLHATGIIDLLCRTRAKIRR